MDKKQIPFELHHLIPLVGKWGIEDDGFRDSQIYNSSNDELRVLVEGLALRTLEVIYTSVL